jgi:hypothetical protein
MTPRRSPGLQFRNILPKSPATGSKEAPGGGTGHETGLIPAPRDHETGPPHLFEAEENDDRT